MTIETHRVWYLGFEFDSKLEANWAATLGKVGVWWNYHPGSLPVSDGRRYEPDFLLKNDVLFEVKGAHLDRLEKLQLLQSDRVVVGYDPLAIRCTWADSSKAYAKWTPGWSLILTAGGEWVLARPSDSKWAGHRKEIVSATDCQASRHEHLPWHIAGGARRVL